jgi:endonuclease/exonuclease/phosphatase family metal-dependent hydrolase
MKLNNPSGKSSMNGGGKKDFIRIMTYNVHRWKGMDGKISPWRIFDVIKHYTPDIVALQEVTRGQINHTENQLDLVAGNLSMSCHFHPSCKIRGEDFGNAILSHFPMRLLKAGPLPSLPDRPYLEPRSVIWVEIKAGNSSMQVFNTHLGLNRQERIVQADALISTEWVGNPACHEPIVICGDLNSRPATPAYRRLASSFKDVQVAAANHRPRKTWSGLSPLFRIDHILVSPLCVVGKVKVGNTRRARMASDHLPLVVDLHI